MGTSITIERFAEIRAEMETGKLREEALLHHHVGVEEWTAASREFLMAMKDELSAGRFELSNRYSTAFLTKQKALSEKNTKTEKNAAPRAAPLQKVESPAPPALSENNTQRPTYEIAASAPAAFTAPGPVEVRIVPKARPATVAFAMPTGPATPFQEGDSQTGLANALRHAEETTSKEKSTPLPIGATHDEIDISAIRRSVTPFAGGSATPSNPSPASNPAEPQAALPAQVSSSPREPQAYGGVAEAGATAEVDIKALMKDVLVFNSSKPSEKSAPIATSAPTSAPAKTGLTFTGTTDVDISAIARSALAFGTEKPTQQVAAAVPTLTVQQYASMCVDIELNPKDATAILAKYGTNDAGRRVLDIGWSRIFAEQPARKKAFDEAKVAYRTWLDRGGRPG